MNDITDRKDIEFLLAAFYNALLQDHSIDYIFTDVAKINLNKHLPHIVDFWEQNLLNTGNYRNNVLKVHVDLNEKVALTPAHFNTWLSHLNQTIDANFYGINAEMMKTRALSIATVMEIKIQKV